MIRGYQRLAIAVLAFVLYISTGMTAFATGTTQTGNTNKETKELTEEEKKMKEELDKAYKIPTESNSWEGWKKGPGTYGEAAIVMEATTGAILYAKNIDAKEYPASITKVLTALIALENGNFSDKVTFSHDCVSFLQPGDSSVGLKEGNVITLEQALYATLLASANEAAYAVGENVGKNAGYDYNWFIEQMNTRAKQLGCVNSNFVNTNGLHDKNHYTCARDMALIGSELFKHPEFFEIVQTMEYKIPKSKTVEEHVFQQKDKMLHPENENYYKYAVGGKTGYTSDALSTLITMAEKGDMKLVCVVLRTHGKNVYPDTTNLLKYAFKNFSKVDISGQEKSQDISGLEEGDNYVVLPKGVSFEELDMELTPADGDSTDTTVMGDDAPKRDSTPQSVIPNTATLTYTYKGNYVGTAKATLSDSYKEEHYADVTPISEEEADKKDEKSSKDSSKKVEESGIFKIPGVSRVYEFLRWSERSKTDKIILLVSAVLLAVLVISFIIVLIRQMAARKRKRSRRR